MLSKAEMDLKKSEGGVYDAYDRGGCAGGIVSTERSVDLKSEENADGEDEQCPNHCCRRDNKNVCFIFA